jgi:hypothetical protein
LDTPSSLVVTIEEIHQGYRCHVRRIDSLELGILETNETWQQILALRRNVLTDVDEIDRREFAFRHSLLRSQRRRRSSIPFFADQSPLNR